MKLRIICIGDVVGSIGCALFQKHISHLKSQYKIDGIIVNGENSGHQGRGITSRIVQFFRHNGADVITSGNHIWFNQEIYPYLSQHTDLLRPANFPRGTPGVGVTTFQCKGIPVAVINLQGRVFMREAVDCPFRALESLLIYLQDKAKVIIVDMHAEATSEKIGLAHFADGKVSAVFGTHTHVQTADERILPGGTAFITDLGMVGSLNGMLGMKKEPIIQHFLTQMPTKFVVETSAPGVLSGVLIDIDSDTGRALSIERIRIIDENIHMEEEIK